MPFKRSLPDMSRRLFKRINAALPVHWLLAVAVGIYGFLLLRPGLIGLLALEHTEDFAQQWLSLQYIDSLINRLVLTDIPRFVLGAGLQIMAFGLLVRARIAWSFSLVLLLGSTVFFGWQAGPYQHLTLYAAVLILLLALYWHRFDRSSLIAGGLFTLISVTSLLTYAVLGSLYLGTEFEPAIADSGTALYFSIVAMSTVGFGDIVPKTIGARLFTSSIIILGITVFATSISAIAGPVLNGNLKRLVSGRLSKRMRKNHIIIAGTSTLAQNVYEALLLQQHDITVIISSKHPNPYPPHADTLAGDPSDTSVLLNAGADKARYILALHDDDAENAFIILSAREVKGPDTHTVALVNISSHTNKMRQVGPDILFSLQSLGAEILARTISGQSIDGTMITQMLFSAPETASKN